MLITNYGIEGVTYEVNQNGEKRYTEFITNNPDDTFDNMRQLNFGGMRGIEDNEALLAAYTEPLQEATELWFKMETSMSLLQTLTMTAEEISTYSAVYSDILTYASSMITEFVIGIRPLSEYEDFVQQLYDMGIETCITMKQAALDRYNAR